MEGGGRTPWKSYCKHQWQKSSLRSHKNREITNVLFPLFFQFTKIKNTLSSRHFESNVQVIYLRYLLVKNVSFHDGNSDVITLLLDLVFFCLHYCLTWLEIVETEKQFSIFCLHRTSPLTTYCVLGNLMVRKVVHWLAFFFSTLHLQQKSPWVESPLGLFNVEFVCACVDFFHTVQKMLHRLISVSKLRLLQKASINLANL